ncbi:MAG TPA: CoA transferase [Acidimicrobiales bacterium]|nr:CoA transferase [Acidimicrobiales bacterium]
MDDPPLRRWAKSGAMALTGLPEMPLGPPEGLVEGVERLARPFPGLDALALLGERAALMGLWRRGPISCGGSCRLLPTAAADAWIAVSLPRAEDFETVPAWLELDEVPATTPATWSAVARSVAMRDPSELVERAVLLGLAVARVGEAARTPAVTVVPLGPAPARDPTSGLLVVDLSSLWAGPLCGDLLARAGATVVKVESTGRPDGARRGPPAFFDLLNGRKRSVALDFRSEHDVLILREIVRRADVVIEASRPRALAQLGVVADEIVRAGGPQVWVSITGHGRAGDGAGEAPGGRAAFGDDAAAAGGLVVWHGSAPMFCADAVADPLTGLAAAGACLEALAGGGRWLLDVSMAGVCAGLWAGPTLAAPDDLGVEPPRARPIAGPAADLGADTAEFLAELGLRR